MPDDDMATTGEFVAGSTRPRSQRTIPRNAHPVVSRGGDGPKDAELSDEWLDICRGVPMRLLAVPPAYRKYAPHYCSSACDDRYGFDTHRKSPLIDFLAHLAPGFFKQARGFSQHSPRNIPKSFSRTALLDSHRIAPPVPLKKGPLVGDLFSRRERRV